MLLAITLSLALNASAAFAQARLSAYRKGNTVYGSFVPQEYLVTASLVITGETDAKRYELFGAGELNQLEQNMACAFSVDLSGAPGMLRVTDRKGGTSEFFAAMTQAQRDDMLSGSLTVRVYRSASYDDNDLLAQCAVEPASTEMTLTSAGVVNGVLDDAFGKKGEQKHKGIPTRSMPLSIQNIPEGTRALALTMIDPDGQDWVHWVAANLPVMEELPENASIDLAEQMVQGKNDFGATGYGGPTPPTGTHHYVITVYALSQPLGLKNGFKYKAFQKALEDRVLAQASLTAAYSKK